MAAALFSAAVANDPTRRRSGIQVRSAGTDAADGGAATELAVTVMRHQRLDLSTHRATQFSEDAAQWADVILTMTNAQRQQVLDAAPAARSKTFTIAQYVGDDAEVVDPLVEGMLEAYERCASRLGALIPQVMARMRHM